MVIDLSNPAMAYIDPDRGIITSVQNGTQNVGSGQLGGTQVHQTSINQTVMPLQQQSEGQISHAAQPEQPPAPPLMSSTPSPLDSLPFVRLSHTALNIPTRRARDGSAIRESENEMFHQMLMRSGPVFHHLSNTWAGADRKMRTAHLCYQNRTFALGTILLQDIDRTNGSVANPYGCIFWQVSRSPPRAVTITVQCRMNLTTGQARFLYTCSCNPSMTVELPESSCCDHISEARQESSSMNRMRFILNDLLTTGLSRSFYGDVLNINQSFPVVQLQRTRQDRSESSERQKYSLFLQFDSERKLFCPLVSVKGKKIQCLQCRIHRSRRVPCVHEIQWENSTNGGLDDSEGVEYDADETEYGHFLEDNDQDGAESNQTPRRRRPVNFVDDDIEKYCFRKSRLPLLPCTQIQQASYRMATDIDDSKGRRLIVFEDFFGVCKHCGFKRSQQSLPPDKVRLRATMLFTLAQQIQVVEVEDWVCPSCSRVVYFTGVGRALFPLRKTYTLTYELLYYFVHNVCRLGISFRSQYEIYHRTQISQSSTARFENNSEIYTLSMGSCRSGRRRCAEAFRFFIQCIDTNNPDLCSHLFTCKDCEKPLTRQEHSSLGLEYSEDRVIKRFSCLAIDGTTAGVLTYLPNYDRNATTLSINKSIQQNHRIITNKIIKQALKKLFKLIHSRTEVVVSKSRILPRNSTSLDFQLCTKKSKSNERKNQQNTMTKEDIAILRRIFLDDHCFCGRSSPASTTHSPICSSRFCKKINNAFKSIPDCPDILRLLQLFISIENRTEDIEEQEEEEQEEENDDDDVDEDEDEDEEEDNEEEEHEEEEEEEETAEEVDNDQSSDDESVLDVEQYYGTNNHNENDPRSSSTVEENNQRRNNGRPRHRRTVQVSNWYASVKIPNASRCGLLIEAFNELLKMLLFDNVSIPYVRPCSTPSDTDHPDHHDQNNPIFEETGHIKLNGDSLGINSFRVHSTLIHALESYADCDCTPLPIEGDCVNCIGRLAEATTYLENVNTILYVFLEQLLLHRHILKRLSIIAASDLASAICEHMDRAKQYFDILATNMSDDCKQYWSTYATCNLRPLSQHPSATSQQSTVLLESQVPSNSQQHSQHAMESQHYSGDSNSNPTASSRDPTSPSDNNSREQQEDGTSQMNDASHSQSQTSGEQLGATDAQRVPDLSPITGFSFPGRPQVRPFFMFDQLEGKQCGKRYAINTNHSPGLLTLQCACGNPKFIAYIVMTRAESTSLTLAAVIMFFVIPAAVILYDNACNTLASALLRIPWLLLLSFILVDRFHYKGHTCNSFFNPDCYRTMDQIKTNAPEINNSKLKRSLYNMRFLAGDTLVYYLNVRFALLNLQAKYSEDFNTKDLEDIDMDRFYAELLPCHCPTTEYENIRYEETDQENDHNDSEESRDSSEVDGLNHNPMDIEYN